MDLTDVQRAYLRSLLERDERQLDLEWQDQAGRNTPEQQGIEALMQVNRGLQALLDDPQRQ